MDKDLRASLVAAGSAAALSALVGIIAGVGFFTLLLRAIVGALLIGGARLRRHNLITNDRPGLFSSAEARGGLRPPRVRRARKGGECRYSSSWRGSRPGILHRARRGPGLHARREIEHGSLRPVPGHRTADAVLERGGRRALSRRRGEPAGRRRERAGRSRGHALRLVPDKGRRPSAGFDDLDVLPDLEGFSDSFTASEFAVGRVLGCGESAGELRRHGLFLRVEAGAGRTSIPPRSRRR